VRHAHDAEVEDAAASERRRRLAAWFSAADVCGGLALSPATTAAASPLRPSTIERTADKERE